MTNIEASKQKRAIVSTNYETLVGRDDYTPSSTNAFLRRFEAICLEPAVRAVSFDFFDTIVWRPVRQPTDLFWRMGDRLRAVGILGEDFSAAKFTECRIHAERKARDRKTASAIFHEVSLQEIYAEFTALSVEQQSAACALEVECEAEMTIIDPVIADAMNFAQSCGKQVLIVSNTYFSKHAISVLAHGKMPFEIPLENIYVSCEYMIDKEAGLLPLVLTERKLSHSEVIHIGDNYWADISASTLAGIRSLHYPKISDIYPDLAEREARIRALDQRNEYPDLDVIQQFRRQVLNQKGASQQLQPTQRIGAYVVGPALAAYAHWLLNEIDRQEWGPVLCLTREGLFLSEIFQFVANHSGRDDFVSLPFLSSRSIVFSCSFFDFSKDELETFLLSRRTPFTIRTFCALVGLDVLAAESFGLEAKHLDFPLISGAALTPILIEAIARNAAIKQAALTFSEQKRASFKRYVDAAFKRHQVQSPNGVIYVADVGWSGRSQRLLERVLHAIGYPVELRGLYMATDQASRTEYMLGLKAQGWLYDGGSPLRSAALGLQSKEIIEQVCSSELGAVQTYDLEGNPVFGQESKSLKQRNDLRQLRNAARDAVHYFCTFQDRLKNDNLKRALLLPQPYRDAYAALLTFPSEDEYALFSAWGHEENNLSSNVENLGSEFLNVFASYATPQQFLETHAYWKLPTFRRVRPQLADSMLLRLAGLPTFAKEEPVPYYVKLHSLHTQSNFSRTAYFSLDDRAVLSLTAFIQGGCEFTFRNDGLRLFEVDAVLVAGYDMRTRERFEAVLQPDFTQYTEYHISDRRVPHGAEFRIHVRKDSMHSALVSVVLCVRRH